MFLTGDEADEAHAAEAHAGAGDGAAAGTSGGADGAVTGGLLVAADRETDLITAVPSVPAPALVAVGVAAVVTVVLGLVPGLGAGVLSDAATALVPILR
jgi:hypothetical protein